MKQSQWFLSGTQNRRTNQRMNQNQKRVMNNAGHGKSFFEHRRVSGSDRILYVSGF